MGSPDPINSPIILFDGVCNLCNQSVLFIIKRDSRALFRFAALQSVQGQRLVKLNDVDPGALHSVVVLMDGKVYQRSRAALEIARRLTGLWPMFYGFMIVPAFLRDIVYDLIARNRYRMFGKKDQCMIPTPDLRARFID